MPRDRTQISLGSLLAAIGAILLLISLFLDWFELNLTAWEGFEIIDLLLAAAAVTVLMEVAARLSRGRPAWQPGVPLWPLGALALVLVVSQLLNHPPAARGDDIDTGAWLALAAASLMLLGGLLGAVNVTLAVEHPADDARDPGRAPAHPGPARAGGAAPSDAAQTEVLQEPGRAAPLH